MPSRSAFLVLTSSLTRYPAWNKSKMGSFLYLSKRRHKNMTSANCFFPFLSCRQRDKATLKLYFIVQIRHIKNRIKGNCKNSKQVSQKPSKITTVTHSGIYTTQNLYGCMCTRVQDALTLICRWNSPVCPQCVELWVNSPTFKSLRSIFLSLPSGAFS